MKTGLAQRSLSMEDFLKVLTVVVLWGCNFVAIRIGLDGFPPLFLVGIRFVLVFFPACLFIPRPKVPFWYLLGYGFFMGIAQFGLLFYSMRIGMPAGIASVMLQAHVIFSLPMAAFFLKEELRPIQVGGILISVVGVLYLSGLFHQDSPIPPLPFFLMILSAFSFGASNVWFRKLAEYNISQGQRTSAVETLVWSAPYIPLPLFLISWFTETPRAVWQAMNHLTLPSVLSLAYMVILATFVAYGLWTSLISKYSASRIGPFSLMVPLVGVLTSVLFLGETITIQQIIGMVITIAGLVFANLGSLIIARLRERV